jgi:hypothetical protein
MLRQTKLTEAEFKDLLRGELLRLGESGVTWEIASEESGAS